MDQKVIKVLGGIIAGFIVLILILFLISSCGKKKYSYEKLETKMKDIAKSYIEKGKVEKPKINNDEVVITLDDMLKNGDIENLNKLFGKKKKETFECNGKVTVTNINNHLNYSTYLSCNNEYKTKRLAEEILKNEKIVTEGIGLYNINNEYIYRGEIKNNYVSFNNNLYRIIKIFDDGTIRLINTNKINNVKWDNRYNPDVKKSDGINEYELNSINSRLKDSLETVYDSYSDEAKSYIVSQNVCIGKTTLQTASKDRSQECSKVYENQYTSLLNIYEYLDASLDTNCKVATDNPCRNYNWIRYQLKNTFLMAADASDSSKVFYIDSLSIKTVSASTISTIYPIIHITNKANYVSGDGTESNPYKFV